MKILLLACLLLLLLYGCRLAAIPAADARQICGTYFRFSTEASGTEYATVTISELNRKALQFTIIRRRKYERVIESHVVEPEYTYRATTGFYYPKDNVLRENETGGIYSFDPSLKLLFNGPHSYQKL